MVIEDMTSKIADELITTIQAAEPSLRALSNEVVSQRPAPGKWSIKEDQGSWKVELQFDELSCYNGTAFSSLIIDTEGAGIVLFKWKGEEGGARYEMRRMISR